MYVGFTIAYNRHWRITDHNVLEDRICQLNNTEIASKKMAFRGVSFFSWRSKIYCIFWESLFCNELKALFSHWVKENATILIYSEVFDVIFSVFLRPAFHDREKKI